MKNELYPIFLKVSELNIMIIGGGTVGYEKLSFLLKSSPNANVVVASKEFSKDIIALANTYKIPLMWRPYSKNLLHKQHMVIAATDNIDVNRQIYQDAKSKQLLVNVADTPDLCDFYLGGIVTKGNVKVAISTNGKSPTMANRLRQFFEEIIPENIDDLVENLSVYRSGLKGNFSQKVSILNKLTKSFIIKE
jgi:precorrin-2 dehydrogenase/sirohydrochlorin ferrochelatase